MAKILLNYLNPNLIDMVALVLGALFFIAGAIVASLANIRSMAQTMNDLCYRHDHRYESWLAMVLSGLSVLFLVVGARTFLHESFFWILGFGGFLTISGLFAGFRRGFAFKNEIEIIDRQETAARKALWAKTGIEPKECKRDVKKAAESNLRICLLSLLTMFVILSGLAIMAKLHGSEEMRIWYLQLFAFFALVTALVMLPAMFLAWIWTKKNKS